MWSHYSRFCTGCSVAYLRFTIAVIDFLKIRLTLPRDRQQQTEDLTKRSGDIQHSVDVSFLADVAPGFGDPHPFTFPQVWSVWQSKRCGYSLTTTCTSAVTDVCRDNQSMANDCNERRRSTVEGNMVCFFFLGQTKGKEKKMKTRTQISVFQFKALSSFKENTVREIISVYCNIMYRGKPPWLHVSMDQ